MQYYSNEMDDTIRLRVTRDVMSYPAIRQVLENRLIKEFSRHHIVHIVPFLDYAEGDLGYAARSFREKLNAHAIFNGKSVDVDIEYVYEETRKFFINVYHDVKSIMMRANANQERNMK